MVVRLFLSLALLIALSGCAAGFARYAPAEVGISGEYRLSGSSAVQPSMIWDDGERTFLVWPEAAELPAVFTRASDGGEALTQGMMRDGRFVLERVHAELIFRAGKAVARAHRRVAKP